MTEGVTVRSAGPTGLVHALALSIRGEPHAPQGHAGGGVQHTRGREGARDARGMIARGGGRLGRGVALRCGRSGGLGGCGALALGGGRPQSLRCRRREIPVTIRVK